MAVITAALLATDVVNAQAQKAVAIGRRIICNVQRYNPTPAQLASVAAIQGKTKTTINGTVPLASPIGLDNRSGKWRITFNVQNLFDVDPPIIASSADSRFGAQATDNVYDEWGAALSTRIQYGVLS